ncbi:Trypanosome variant surface glycoprotein C-terminal domain containing protein, putative [Trypanosoma equiperdum]|uniref:Trypanosome variant surface glycoprotein C-terminal domain containing protein, putative n=1 Tax=Trypanosoma equiperdum TaxID=5694 RepID=A0A1G4IDM0_TRYEQ|nr:Trypanosome variant surface glycoprotein C-terminal domain containing protein, putative [Trypanosoma equiperdum]
MQKNIAAVDEHERKAEVILKKIAEPEQGRGDKLAKTAETADAVKIGPEGQSKTKLKLITGVTDLQLTLSFYLSGQKAMIRSQTKEIERLKAVNNTQIQKHEELCKIGENQDKCDKEKQCSYEDSKETRKKCTYNLSKATENSVFVAQTQTAADNTTTDKCKEKPEKDCKSPDCKWEGTECKDFSILVSKQFALMVSAFVSLREFY